MLLGDPQQLDQPTKGSHPEGTDVSALDHIRGGNRTIPPDMGLFLEETWRLHPAICSYTSELFYDGKPRSKGGLEKQVVKGADHGGGPASALWTSSKARKRQSPSRLTAAGRRNVFPERSGLSGVLFDTVRM